VACRKFIIELEERCSQMNISHPDRNTLWDAVKAVCTMKDDHDNIFSDYRRKKTLKVYLLSTGARLTRSDEFDGSKHEKSKSSWEARVYFPNNSVH
jgi:hypothetical protein